MKAQNLNFQVKDGHRTNGTGDVIRTVALVLVLLISTVFSVSGQSNGFINPYEAERRYYEEFNRRTEGLYRAARTVDRVTNRAINWGSRVVPRGRVVRQVYNRTRNAIQRNGTLPRRYQY